MVATAAVSTARNKLLFSARQLYEIQWPLTVPLITTLKNPTTGALTLPNDGFVIGRHSKQRGGVLSNAQTYNDIMAHGQGSPVMKIPTERRMSGSLEPLELNKQNLQNWL